MSGILMVCDANVCRSVAAELLLSEQFAQHDALAGVRVTSRGAQALSAHSACRMVIDLRDDAEWRKRALRHQSAQLDADAIDDADLILTATVGSRSAVVSIVPGARRKVFTLREALWIAADYVPASGATGNELVQDLVAHLDARRGLQQLPVARRLPWRRMEHPLDIADGHGAPPRAHVATLRQVDSAITGLARILMQDPTSPPLSTRRAGIH